MGTSRAAQTAATSPNLIQVSPGALWYDVTKPADGEILMVSGYTSGAQDQRVYGPAPFTLSGTFMGSTIGESTISYKPSFVDIMIETAVSKVEKVLNTEEARCNFALAELTAENIQISLPGRAGTNPAYGPVATLSTQSSDVMANPGGTGPQIRHIIKVGGLRLVAPTCIAFISANRRISDAAGPFSYVFCGYNAVSTEGFEAPFSRGKETVWRASFEMISSTDRTIGDQLFQFVVRQLSA